jgi:hypothetical protein
VLTRFRERQRICQGLDLDVVVFPLPEGPTKDTNEARSMVKVRSFSASTDTVPVVYVFVRPSATIKLMDVLRVVPKDAGTSCNGTS